MSYQVLARKWRPATFTEMVGQSHVLKALVNALDQQRLHHAYLFTGTRGVGKTTLARLLAKSLNCEQGVSARPCGECSACREIAEGRFVDLLEIDAASRTRVEDTRELLDNVQYAPTRGRYKIYLIDEVHMLSAHSFNALLKTLEEPPPHVKFLLATTDPQKLPVTVLSRCLQFNLKSMTREHIVGYLNHILSEEAVPYEEAALWLLAEAAAGSMRDALSLTDQAIAFGEGQLRETEVAAMLGTVDLKRVLNLVRGLITKDAAALLAQVAELAEHSPDYRALLTELLSTLHRVAIAQAAPEALDNSKGDRDALTALARQAQPEDVHLFYQLGMASAKDLPLAPSERAGFEMALLRMLAFSPSPARSLEELPPLTGQSGGAGEPETTGAEPAGEAGDAPENRAGPETAGVAPEPRAADPEPQASREPERVQAPPDESQLPPQAEQASPEATEQPAPVTPQQAEAEPAMSQALQQPEEAPATQDTAPEAPPESADTAPVDRPEPAAAPAAVRPVPASNEDVPPWEEAPESSSTAADDGESAPMPAVEPEAVTSEPAGAGPARWPETDFDADPQHWWQVTLYRLGLTGMTRTLFAHSQWQDYRDGRLTLLIASNYRKLMNDTHCQRLNEALRDWLPDYSGFDYQFGAAERTPQAWLDQLNHAAWETAVDQLQRDDFVQSLVSNFAAELKTDTVQPRHNPLPTGA